MCKRPTIDTSIFLVLAAFFIAGCNSPMALNSKTKTLDLTDSGIALMTLKIANEYKPAFQVTSGFNRPPMISIRNLLKKKFRDFEIGKPYRSVKKKYNEYLVSLEVAPGKHGLTTISGHSYHIMIDGTFSIPIYETFNIQAGKIVYLGHIETINRKKVSDDQLPAGFMLPMIDQAVCGFSGGTWHVTISDNYDADIVAFKQEYPVIAGHTIEKKVLPPWTKPACFGNAFTMSSLLIPIFSS